MAPTIDVFADVCCPFTHVGLRRFVERRATAGRLDIRLRVRAWPLELVNGSPLDPRVIAEEVEELRRQVTPDSFAGFDRTTFPASSLPAMTLVSHAYDIDLDIGERVSLDLRDVLFEQGEDISRPAVLAEVAARHSLDVDADALGPPDRVLTEYDVGRDRGVIGSPHFFTPDGGFFCPALDIERDDQGRLHILADPDGFDAFIAGCFR